MASFAYTYFMYRALNSYLTGGDIRVLLVMANSTVFTERNVQHIDDFTTLDEMDGANYARQALTGEAQTANTTAERGEFNANDVTIVNLGNGTRPVIGALVFRFVTNDTDNEPIALIDFRNAAGVGISPGGIDFVIQWSPDAIIQTLKA